jgi:prephenate dehydrogenase
MKIAVIGAAGKMGLWFTKFFLEQGASVIVSGRTKKKLLKIKDESDVEVADNATAVKNADRVLICVPIENFEEVVKEIQSYVKPNQVIMDICSIKEFPVAVMHKYIPKATTLGTHPMFGPSVYGIKNQNFILTPTNAKEKQFANDFKAWLEKKKAKVSIMSPRKHDELMSVVLGLSHFVGMVACDTLVSKGDFAEMKKVAGPSFKLLSTLAERVASQDPNFYASLQTNLPNIDEIEGLFYQKAGEWLDIIRKKDQSMLADKMKSVKAKLEKANP